MVKSLEYLKNLTDVLDSASELYYKNSGYGCTMSDTEFDLKFKELQELEKYWGVVYPNSPTQRVGSDAIDSFAKVKHPIPMLTIENTYDDNGLQEWLNKMYNQYHCTFNLSIKYDGVSCELHYKNGVLVEASTRGDKNVGDDITLNVKTIKDIPLTLNRNYHSTIPIVFNNHYFEDKDFYVRGEILMPKSQLVKLNENLDKPFANTRNACSGSIKLLDSKEVAKRGLIFRAWDCYVLNEPMAFNKMCTKFDVLSNLGFRFEYMPFCRNCENTIEWINSFKKQLTNLDYDYDGIVVKVEEMDIQNKIGTKDTRAIEWGIARKWNEEYEAWTELQGVEWSLGAGGSVTPVGLLEPVECGGVLMSNVTLHNAGFVEDFDLHIGNDIKLERSGGVIPHVIEVKHDLLMEMNNAYKKVEIPTHCPVCGTELVREGPLLKCVNKNCEGVIKGQILRFCSKECADIRTIGESVVNDLYNKGLITSIVDLIEIGGAIADDSRYTVVKKHWINTLGEGYGEKSVDNMLKAIKNARQSVPYERLLAGLSIPNVGKVMARTIANRFMDVFDLAHADLVDLVELEGIAETTAQGIIDWIRDGGASVLYCLESYGWNYEKFIEEPLMEENTDKPLDGLKVCFTGKSFRFKGDEVEEYLKSKGATCASVSKSLDYLITGEKPGGSKIQKANDFGIKIITEKDFYGKFKI